MNSFYMVTWNSLQP